MKLEFPKPSFKKTHLKFILFFRDWNHSNQYAIYDFTVTEHCLAMNDKTDKTIEGIEMIPKWYFQWGRL